KSESLLSPVWKMPVDGGEERQILDSVIFSAFAVTQNGIYFISERGSQAGLMYFSFSTGISKAILTIEKPTHMGLAVSPDEQWLLYSQVDQSGSDLVLVENFR